MTHSASTSESIVYMRLFTAWMQPPAPIQWDPRGSDTADGSCGAEDPLSTPKAWSLLSGRKDGRRGARAFTRYTGAWKALGLFFFPDSYAFGQIFTRRTHPRRH